VSGQRKFNLVQIESGQVHNKESFIEQN